MSCPTTGWPGPGARTATANSSPSTPSLAERIRGHIRDHGPVSTASFRDVEDRVQWWWDNTVATSTKAARAMLEVMFVTGEMGIARRDGSRRYYDLIERLVAPELLATHASEEDQRRHRLLSRHRGVGLMGVGGASELVMGTGKAADRTADHRGAGRGRDPHPGGRRGVPRGAPRPRRGAADPRGDRHARRLSHAIGLIPGAPGSADVGSPPGQGALRLRLHLGGLRPRAEAAPRVLRAARSSSATAWWVASSHAWSAARRRCASPASGSRTASSRWRSPTLSRPCATRWRPINDSSGRPR